MRILQKHDYEMFVHTKVRDAIFPTAERFQALLTGAPAVVARKPDDASGMASVKAHLPTFLGVPKGCTPLEAVRCVYAWNETAKTAASLPLVNAIESRRVMWATCALKDKAAQWYVSERRRAEIAGTPITTFAQLQKAMLEYFVEGQVNDLVTDGFTSKHLRDFPSFTACVHWLMSTTDLMKSTAASAGAWSDEVLVQLACRHLKVLGLKSVRTGFSV
jgi:hypothetical protein